MAIDGTIFTPGALASFEALAVGFALAGLLASAFELATDRRASFALLERGGVAALAVLPMLALGAPYIILRSALAGGAGAPRSVSFVMLATIFASGWGLVSGTLALDAAALLTGA